MIHSFTHNPIPYLIWVGVGLPGFALAALMAAYWMRFDAPIWNKKSRAKYQQPAAEPKPNFPPLVLGDWSVPEFDRLSAAFGTRLNQYPERASIPKVDRKYEDVVSGLFFRGGSLAEHGLKLKSGINHGAAMTAIRAWLCSFDPKHEHKTETVAWALSEWCEAA